jgi:L-fuconolactonase
VIVDAHHHVWDPRARPHTWLDSYPALRRAFSMADYGRVRDGHGVTASVLVQVLAATAETEEFLALAAGGHQIAGVVGWADLTAPDLPGQLARLRELPGGSKLVSIRHLVQDEPDADWLARPEVLRGLAAVGAAGLSYDLLVRPAQLPAAIRAVSALDEVQFVLDHGGKPEIARGLTEPWDRLTAGLAARPNVTCKLSGLVTEAGPGWDAARIAPYADHLIGVFGPARLMFGSDWPVCTLAAGYGDVLGLARELLAQLSPAERDAVLGGNAVRAYRLTGLTGPGMPETG